MTESFAAWHAESTTPAPWWPPPTSLDVAGFRVSAWFSLRWVLVHMIEEYARHNGHADLIRERLDGSTGE